MTASNGNGQPTRLTSNSKIPDATAKRLEVRSAAFQRMTAGKGKPLTYGAGGRDRK